MPGRPPPARKQASTEQLRRLSFGCSRWSQQGAGEAPGAVSDGARRAIDGDRCTRNRGYICTDLERITDILAFELLGEYRKIHRKIAVRFVVFRDENPCQEGFGIDS